jgi:hypothetical protein
MPTLLQFSGYEVSQIALLAPIHQSFLAELPLVIIVFRVALTGFKPTAPTVKAYVDDQSFNPSTAAGSLAG